MDENTSNNHSEEVENDTVVTETETIEAIDTSDETVEDADSEFLQEIEDNLEENALGDGTKEELQSLAAANEASEKEKKPMTADASAANEESSEDAAAAGKKKKKKNETMETIRKKLEIPPDQMYLLDQLKSAQTLLMIGLIGAPVSLMFGGLLLSTIALICSIICFVKVKKVLKDPKQYPMLDQRFRKPAILAIIMGVVAFGLNLANIIFLMPVLMQIAQSSDPSSALGTYLSSPYNSGWSEGSSAWG